jgi:hypothetical protein
MDLVFLNSPGMLQVALSNDPTLKLDRFRPAFVLTYKVQYLKYTKKNKRVSRFNFEKAITEYLSREISSNLFFVNVIDAGVANFYEVLTENFAILTTLRPKHLNVSSENIFQYFVFFL